MSRRRKKQLIPTVWLDWTPAVAELFGLVPAGWAPPLKVRVCGSLRKSTWSARFRTPDGGYTMARVRMERCPHSGAQVVLESSISITLSLRKAA